MLYLDTFFDYLVSTSILDTFKNLVSSIQYFFDFNGYFNRYFNLISNCCEKNREQPMPQPAVSLSKAASIAEENSNFR